MEATFQTFYLTPIWYILLLIFRPSKHLVLLIPFLMLVGIMSLLYLGKLSKTNEAAELLFFTLFFSLLYILKHDSI